MQTLSLQNANGKTAVQHWLDAPISTALRVSHVDKLNVTTIRAELDAVRVHERKEVRKVRLIYTQTLRETGDAKAAKKKADEVKKNEVAYVTPAGTFSRRANDALTAHSGIAMLDLDDLADVEGTKAKLAACPNVGAVFLSVRGTGLRVFVPVKPIPTNAAEHKAAYCATVPVIEAAGGITVDDNAGEDVARASFVTSDPAIYIDPDAVAVEWHPEPQLEQQPCAPEDAPQRQPARDEARSTGTTPPELLKTRREYVTRNFRVLRWESDMEAFIECPAIGKHTTGDGEKDCAIWIDGTPSIHCLHRGACKGAVDAAERKLRAEIDSRNPSLPPWEDALDLAITPPPLPPELIKGVLHQGAKLVLGGASKSNKTWSLLDMAVSVASGSEWWNLETVQGRVLYLNLEIAAPFFARRIKTVAEAKGVELQRGQFTVWNLRGHSCDIGALSTRILPDIKAGAFSLVILDPIYKCLGGRDENKAGEIASLLNQIEHIAVESGAAVAFGAHYSKGNQSAKESIDRIGGSGVFARDPDAILTLTKHEEEDAFTCEPTLRNHAPHDPFVLRWKWPLMRRDDTLDPAKLKPQRTGREPRFTPADLVECIGKRKMKSSALAKLAAEEKGIKGGSFYDLLRKAKTAGLIIKSTRTELLRAA